MVRLCGVMLALCSTAAVADLPPFNYPEPPREGAKDWFRVAEQGRACCVIVTPAKASPGVERTAKALGSYLNLVTGGSFQVLAEPAPIPAGLGAIHVGDTTVARRVELRLPDVRYGEEAYPNANGYVIRTVDSRTLVIRGASEKATEFGVVGFLRRYAGVRQYWMGPAGGAGDVTPPRATLTVPEVEWRDWPCVMSRWLSIGGFPAGATTALDFFRRNNVLPCGENYATWLPPEKYRETHPEYFGLVNGQRRLPGAERPNAGWQPCVSNPDVVKIMTEGVRAFFRENPSAPGKNFSLNDGGGNCECAACRAMDAPGTDYARGVGMTDRYVKFTNEVAEAAGREFPGKILVFLAYGGAASPPVSVKPGLNVLPVLTVNNAFEAWDGWSKTGATRMGLYLHHNDNIYFVLPKCDPGQTVKRFRYALDSGRLRVFYMEAGTFWPTTGHLAYIISELLWDPRQNPEALMDAYCVELFGPAAGAMKRFYATLEAGYMRWLDKEGQPYPAGKDMAGTRYASAPEQFRTLQPSEADLAAAALAEAAATAGLDARAQRRVALVQAAFRLQELAARRYWAAEELKDRPARTEADAQRVVEEMRRIVSLTEAIREHVVNVLEQPPLEEYKLFRQLRPSDNVSYDMLRTGALGPALTYALDSGARAAADGLREAMGAQAGAAWWRKAAEAEKTPMLKGIFQGAALRAAGVELKNLLTDAGFEEAGKRMTPDERELDRDVVLQGTALRQVGGIYAWFPERTPCRAALTRKDPHSGSYCLVMEHFYRAVCDLQSGVAAKPGARYHAGVWVKRNAAAGKYRVAIAAHLAGGGVARPLMEVSLDEPFDRWREVSGDVVAPPETRRLSVQIFVDRQDKGACCWVDDVFIGEYPAEAGQR